MSNRLYVGNIPYSLSDSELGDLFASNGFTPSCPHILTFKEDGRSRGFGFVDLASALEVENAIRVMNGVSVGGRSIKVSAAIEKQNRQDAQNRENRSDPASFNSTNSHQNWDREERRSPPRGRTYRPQNYDW
jgi:RNA recognition motif-containing protein